MIDPNSGVIAFDDGLALDAQTTLSKIEKISIPKLVSSVSGRAQLSIGAHLVEGKNWGVGVVFVQSKLKQILLQCLDVNEIESSAWSLDNEKLRKSAHDAILEKYFSLNNIEQSLSSITYKFMWGKVSSLLDIRGVQALILIEYL